MHSIYWISVFLFTTFTLYWVLPALAKIYLKESFLLSVTNKAFIYLTFDDGPNPEATPYILDILQKHNAKATFFVTGERAEQYPEIVQRIYHEGHTLGYHSYKHLHPWKTGPWASFLDMKKGVFTIKRILPEQQKILFRPPYGKLNLVTLFYLLIKKQKVIFWDNDCKDYISDTAIFLVDEISKKIIKGKQVILLHDGSDQMFWKKRLETTGQAVSLLLQRFENKFSFENLF